MRTKSLKEIAVERLNAESKTPTITEAVISKLLKICELEVNLYLEYLRKEVKNNGYDKRKDS